MASELLFKEGDKVLWLAGVGGFVKHVPINATVIFAKRWPNRKHPPYIVQIDKPKRIEFVLERDLRNEDGSRRIKSTKKPVKNVV